MDIYTAAIRGQKRQLLKHIESDPRKINQRFKILRSQLVNKPNENDWMTPLAFALLGNRVVSMEILLEHGADPTIDNGEGLSLRQFVEQHGCHKDLLERLDKAIKHTNS